MNELDPIIENVTDKFVNRFHLQQFKNEFFSEAYMVYLQALNSFNEEEHTNFEDYVASRIWFGLLSYYNVYYKNKTDEFDENIGEFNENIDYSKCERFLDFFTNLCFYHQLVYVLYYYENLNILQITNRFKVDYFKINNIIKTIEKIRDKI